MKPGWSLTGQGRRRVEPTSADMFLSQERGTVPLIVGGGGELGTTDYIFSLVPKSKKIRWLNAWSSFKMVRSFRFLVLDLAARWQAVVPDVRRLVNGEAAVRWTAPRGRVRGWGGGGGRHLRTFKKDTLRHRKNITSFLLGNVNLNGWDLAEYGWDLAEHGWDLAKNE